LLPLVSQLAETLEEIQQTSREGLDDIAKNYAMVARGVAAACIRTRSATIPSRKYIVLSLP
jgi:hypothetical protein